VFIATGLFMFQCSPRLISWQVELFHERGASRVAVRVLKQAVYFRVDQTVTMIGKSPVHPLEPLERSDGQRRKIVRSFLPAWG
jgi:hypothetical protein